MEPESFCRMSFLSTSRILTVARTVSYCKHLTQLNSRLSECSPVVYVAFSSNQRRLYAEDSSSGSNKSVSKASASGVGDAKPITFKEKGLLKHYILFILFLLVCTSYKCHVFSVLTNILCVDYEVSEF